MSSSSFLSRFLRQERGAAAVEFALVAAPFIALLFAIIELGMIFMASVTLDNATHTAARTIRTGQTVSPTGAPAQATALKNFKDSICNEMGWMKAECKTSNGLVVDVRTFTQFQNVTYGDPVVNNTFNPGAVTFDTGGPSQIVLVRAYYPWKLYLPMMAGALEKMPGKTLLTSVTSFRTEPYTVTTP